MIKYIFHQRLRDVKSYSVLQILAYSNTDYFTLLLGRQRMGQYDPLTNPNFTLHTPPKTSDETSVCLNDS
jgi:hypothetical protein